MNLKTWLAETENILLNKDQLLQTNLLEIILYYPI